MEQQMLSEYFPEVKETFIYEHEYDNGKKIQLRKIIGNIPLDIENNSYLSIIRNKDKDIHNIATYPCKYIPELPRWAIKKYSKKGEMLLDPFIGGGTTFIEALRLRRNCIGIDYNPYARLISNVKSTPLKPDKLLKIKKELLKEINSDVGRDILIPNFRGIDFWFSQEVIIALSKIKKYVSQLEYKDYRDFFLVAFSLCVRKSSYIAPGQILTAKRKDWREIKQLTQTDVLGMFSSICEEYIKYMGRFNQEINNNFSRIIGSDAKNIELPDELEDVDLILGSPPYINSMDYVWANRLRLHWLDLVENDKDRLNLYSNEIGTERIRKTVYSRIGRVEIDEIDTKIEEIYHSYNSSEQSKLRSRVTYKYFIDMKKHFKEAFTVLKHGGKYCIVIGDNNIRKVFIPTSYFLSLLAEEAGFQKEFQFQIILKNRSLSVERNVDFASNIKYDRMIVLVKD